MAMENGPETAADTTGQKPADDDFALAKPRILVVGVGGAGCNAVNRMINDKVGDIVFCAANTDAQALQSSKAEDRLLLGRELTHGLGAGGKPEIGREAALRSLPAIKSLVAGTDMVFVAAGMGGGTGTGAAPVIAKAAMDAGALTVAIVTKPFNFEGRNRLDRAASGLAELSRAVDSFIVVSNDKLMLTHGDMSSLAAFAESDRILARSVKTITDLIYIPGLINLDFADVRATLKGSGLAVIGFGDATGENKAEEAARQAVSSPLLEASIKGAGKALINITVSQDTTLKEIEQTVGFITESAGKNDNIIFGEMVDQGLKDEITVSAIATGFEVPAEAKNAPAQPDAAGPNPAPDAAAGDDGTVLPAFLARILATGANQDQDPADEAATAQTEPDGKTPAAAAATPDGEQTPTVPAAKDPDGQSADSRDQTAALAAENDTLRARLDQAAERLAETAAAAGDREADARKLAVLENQVAELKAANQTALEAQAALRDKADALAAEVGTANARADSLADRNEVLRKAGQAAGTEPAADLEDLVAENDRLRDENAKLKAALGDQVARAESYQLRLRLALAADAAQPAATVPVPETRPAGQDDPAPAAADDAPASEVPAEEWYGKAAAAKQPIGGTAADATAAGGKTPTAADGAPDVWYKKAAGESPAAAPAAEQPAAFWLAQAADESAATAAADGKAADLADSLLTALKGQD